jgi:hypothetical protein
MIILVIYVARRMHMNYLWRRHALALHNCTAAIQFGEMHYFISIPSSIYIREKRADVPAQIVCIYTSKRLYRELID